MTEETHAVEAALRRYFAAGGEELVELVTGPAQTLERLWLPVRGQVELLERRVDVRNLAVERVDGDEAVAALEATEHVRVRHPVEGEGGYSTRLSGPVTLRRVRGAWRVADYARDGRLLSAAFVEPEGAVEADGVTLRVPGMMLAGRTARVFLELENRRRSPLVITELRREAKVLGLWWQPMRLAVSGTLVVGAGETTATHAGWRERLSLPLRFLLRVGETEGPAQVELRVAVTPDARVVPLPPPARRLGLGRHRRSALVWGPVAVFGILALLHQWLVVGVLVAAQGAFVAAVLGHLAWRRSLVPRQAVRFGVLALAMIASGVYIAASGGNFGG